MLENAAIAISLSVALLGLQPAAPADCGSTPEKGWLKFLDRTDGFCFWYPPSYKTKARLDERAFPNENHLLATLISSEPRKAFSEDKQPAAIQLWLLTGVFDLQKLIQDAPTGYDTPPAPKRYGTKVFYYYGRGGGGVAYPDKYYFNLDGRALRIVFDGPYRGGSNSPTRETQAVETLILTSFRAMSR